MIVLATGGRNFCDRNYVYDVMSKLHLKHKFSAVVQGGATGVDTLVKDWTMQHGIQPITMDACWDFLGHGAGMVRNQKMIDLITVDLVIGFPGNIGTGTMMLKAASKGIKVVDTVDVMGY